MTAHPAGPFRSPAAVEVGPAFSRGEATTRLMVILRAPGCVYARRTGGCTNCGFHHLSTGGEPVPAADLAAQLGDALAGAGAERERIGHLDLFCSGSFLCEEEIPREARTDLVRIAAAGLPSLRSLMVESRPEYVTGDALDEVLAPLAGRDALLEIGIGLESVDAEIRERRIRKGFTLPAFERAAERLAGRGAGLAAYLLLKPLGTGEEEAVRDVVASGRWLAELARRLGLPVRIALEPTFVPEGTPLAEALRAGRYAPPSLWSVLRAVLGIAGALPVHVGLSTEGLPADHLPSGCPHCTGKLRAALAEWNRTQDPAPLRDLGCGCRGAAGPAGG